MTNPPWVISSCPHIRSTSDGTNYCDLAAHTGEEVQALQSALLLCVDVLERNQWPSGPYGNHCHICGEIYDEHLENCQVVRAIKLAKELLPD